MSAAVKIPVGPARGKLITECTVAELEAACDDVDARLCANPKGTDLAKKHKVFVSAARLLLKQRKFPTGSYDTTEAANLALRDAAEVGHLLAPGPQLAAVLPGCAILISAFRVNVRTWTFPDDEHPEQLVPNREMLNHVSNLLGISWRSTQRTDNGRDPYVRSYMADGLWRDYDASERGFQGNAGIDMRQDSPRVRRLREKNRTNGNRIDIERRREFIDSDCDTQARLRVVRQLGVKSSYTLPELARPFFAARLVFTAKTDDPALKAMMGKHVIDSFGSARTALFGKRAG